MIGGASLLLILAAGWSLAWPARAWVPALVVAPAVVCGGLTAFAGETLLPQLGVLVAYPLTLLGVAGGFLASRDPLGPGPVRSRAPSPEAPRPHG